MEYDFGMILEACQRAKMSVSLQRDCKNHAYEILRSIVDSGSILGPTMSASWRS